MEIILVNKSETNVFAVRGVCMAYNAYDTKLAKHSLQISGTATF